MKNTLFNILFWATLGLPCLKLQAQYAVLVEPDIPYGSAINYAGCNVDLFLDLYKPINNNTSRPLMVLVHGGSFISGERTDANMVALANEMASRGHVVASVSYRLGWHTTALESGTCALGCWTGALNIPACLYAADTLETIRAAYRAMQDVKGAIRFMKNRSALDSTNIYRTSVGGHSAGAIITLLAAYMDNSNERPAATYAQAQAPVPYVSNACSTLNTCGGTSRVRGDLGSIRGSLNLGGADESVNAVMAFAGAVMDLSILDNDVCKPSLYVYHLTCDHIVPNGTSPIMSGLNHCLYYCCPQPSCRPVTGMPWAHGSQSILTYVTNNPGLGISIADEIIARGSAMNSLYGCINFDPNINACGDPDQQDCHDMLMNASRYQEVADFLNSSIPLDPNTQCIVGIQEAVIDHASLQVHPNPHQDQFAVTFPQWGRQDNEALVCYDAMGKRVDCAWTRTDAGALVRIEAPAGMYAVRVRQGDRLYQARALKLR